MGPFSGAFMSSSGSGNSVRAFALLGRRGQFLAFGLDLSAVAADSFGLFRCLVVVLTRVGSGHYVEARVTCVLFVYLRC